MLRFSTSLPLYRRASMTWKPIKYSQTRRRNARKRRALQLMVDAQLTKKYARFTSNKPTAFISQSDAQGPKLQYNLQKNMDAVLKKARNLQPVHVGSKKLAKRSIVDQWFKMQAEKAEF